MKGKPDLRVSTKEYRDNYDMIFTKDCPGCDKVLCSCKIKQNKKVPKNLNACNSVE